MTDLTKITTPFGLLDAETQEALRAHGGPYELWNGRDWEDRLAPRWCGFAAYRVKPTPPKPREWWIVKSGGGLSLYGTPSAADTSAKHFGGEVIHVREVL